MKITHGHHPGVGLTIYLVLTIVIAVLLVMNKII